MLSLIFLCVRDSALVTELTKAACCLPAAAAKPITALACDLPEVCFVYKPKYPFKKEIDSRDTSIVELLGREGPKLVDRIVECPNFILTPNHYETGVVVGLSDVVISACFTSTTVEAIGCGSKGIYYNPTNIYPNAFWNEIPGIVCRDKESLKRRLYELLYKTSEQEYRLYVQKYMGDIDGFFDGGAITRLRRNLAAHLS